ncbi:hypothetical protein FRC11_005768 [Ceratobasidium sp. 423]|nr:hypothetical protein FRC11_005768 [Ceratobasidium sp. 423]
MSEIEIKTGELVFYNEALIANARRVRDLEQGDGYVREISDVELNQRLSQLPRGSTITCLIDCCASGRVHLLDDKIDGGGVRGGVFRGKPTQAVGQGQARLPLASPYTQGAQEELSIEEPLTIVFKEATPEREKALNNVIARISAWNACHQRQWAFETDDGGLLTHSFTSVIHEYLESNGSIAGLTYNKLFNEVR